MRVKKIADLSRGALLTAAGKHESVSPEQAETARQLLLTVGGRQP